mmetsp:Transcript_2145/g.5042  ORF Transcript_2145/g.5042 Transcript_2145/m.5042 type:complete len:435 (+) Transcript_2145:21-1325(+)
MSPFLPLAVPTALPVESTPSSRRPRAAHVLGVTALALFAIAAVLVNVHPLEDTRVELMSDTAAKLFKTALASQHADLARHRAAEAKAKAAIKAKEAGEEGGAQKAKAPMSDAALFQQALKSENKDVAKARAVAAKIKVASHHSSKLGDAFPSSPKARISDAKLFQDALKSQKSEHNAHLASLKRDVKAEVQKGGYGQKAKQKKIDAELRLILGANHDAKKAATKLKVHVVKARQQQLAMVQAKHAVHKLTAAQRKMSKFNKLFQEAKKEIKKDPTEKHATKTAKAPAHPKAKHLTSDHDGHQVLNESAEKQLYKFLESADGDAKHPKPAAVEKKHVVKQKKEVKAHKKVEHKVKEEAHKEAYVLPKGFAKKQGAHGWATDAMKQADSSVSLSHTANSYRRAEEARSDAIEDSLLSGGSIGPASAKGKKESRGRT